MVNGVVIQHSRVITEVIYDRSTVMEPIMALTALHPVAAAGYSLLYLLFGGGLGGAVVIFIVAKMLGK